jgi:hypothetical protein
MMIAIAVRSGFGISFKNIKDPSASVNAVSMLPRQLDAQVNPWWRAALARPRWAQRLHINGTWISFQTWQALLA